MLLSLVSTLVLNLALSNLTIKRNDNFHCLYEGKFLGEFEVS